MRRGLTAPPPDARHATAAACCCVLLLASQYNVNFFHNYLRTICAHFFLILTDECGPTTTSSPRPRPVARPPAASTSHGAVSAAADARTHHVTSPRRSVPARLALSSAPARATTKWNANESVSPQSHGTKWNAPLCDGSGFDPIPRPPQYRSETDIASRVFSECFELPSWTSFNVSTGTRR